MNVWLIKIGELLPIDSSAKKMRTALLGEKLAERGHSVLWWTSAFDHFKKRWIFDKDTEFALSNRFRIMALKGTGYRKNVSLSRLLDHRVITQKFKRLASATERPDAIVTAMPSHDLAYQAVRFAKQNGIPILVDIRDPWPDIFLQPIPRPLHKLARLVLYRDFRMVKKTMTQADALISMMDALLEWGLSYAERKNTPRDRVFHLGYKRPGGVSGKANGTLDILASLKGKFVVTFVGTFATYHNPSILLDAAEKLKDSESDIFFVLAGDGKLSYELKARAKILPNVALPGWLNQDEIAALIHHSHIGVCSSTENAQFFPNKVFTYMSAGLPVLSAFQGELKEMIETRKVGLNYPPTDVHEFIDCIRKFKGDPGLYERTSRNALKTFNEIFDADLIYDRYAEHIERIVYESYK